MSGIFCSQVICDKISNQASTNENGFKESSI